MYADVLLDTVLNISDGCFSNVNSQNTVLLAACAAPG